MDNEEFLDSIGKTDSRRFTNPSSTKLLQPIITTDEEEGIYILNKRSS